MEGIEHLLDSFELRRLTQSDWAEALHVYRACEDFLALGPEPHASKGMVLADIAASEQEGGVYEGIYDLRNQIVGVVEYVPKGFNEDLSLAFFSLLMIAAPLRGKGIGRRIVEVIEREVRKDIAIKSILTAVQVNNHDGLRFWLRNGYEISGEAQTQPDTTVTHLLSKDVS